MVAGGALSTSTPTRASVSTGDMGAGQNVEDQIGEVGTLLEHGEDDAT